MLEGGLQVKLPTIWTGEKQRWEESEKSRAEQRRGEEKRREEERRKKIQVRKKSRKAAIHSVFPMICGSGGSKSMLTKAAGAEPSGGMRDEKKHDVVARSTFASEKAKTTPHIRSTFGN